MKQNNAKLSALSVFLVIFFAFALAQSGQAAERFVPSQYTVIQSASNADADDDSSVQFQEDIVRHLMGYVVTNSYNSELYLINFITGEEIPIGNTGVWLMRGLECSPVDGSLYGMAPQAYPSLKNDFYRIDRVTGHASYISSIQSPSGNNVKVQNLAFANDGTLYVIPDTTSSNVSPKTTSLFIVDPETGTWSDYQVISPSQGLVWAFAISDQGRAIGWNDTEKKLFEINLNNGQPTVLGSLTGVFEDGHTVYPYDTSFPALDYGSDGKLYGWNYNKYLFEIDIDNLTATRLRHFSTDGYGFAFVDKVFFEEYLLTTSVIGGHGNATLSNGSFPYGTVVTINATPDVGYRVRTWNGTNDDSTMNNTNIVSIYSNTTVTVEFEPIPYDLDAYVIGGHGTIDPSSGTYEFGTISTLTANPDEGYQVKEWHGTDDDSSTNNTNTVTIDSNMTVTVEFEPIPYNLDAYVIGDHGTIHPSSGIYDFGTILTLTATPDEGYQVKEWHGTDDDPSINNSNTVTIDSDKIISVIFEKIPDTITFNKCNIKAGKIRSIYQPTDSIIISGYSFDAADSDFSSANTIYVEILNANEETPIFSDEINVNAGKYENGKFNYKGSNGRITSLEFDISKNTFSITAKNIDLTGLSSPVAVEIEIGDYFGTGVANDGEVLASGGNADIINGKNSIPIQLLSGYMDSLRVDKCTFKLGTKKPDTDSLVIQGAIAVEDTSVDIAGEDVVVSWGNYSITLPANDIYRIGYKKSFKYKKPKGSDSSVAAAVFDLEKCTFKIVIKNANISSQNNPIDFSIQFADFSKTVTLQLTENKPDHWCFP